MNLDPRQKPAPETAIAPASPHQSTAPMAKTTDQLAGIVARFAASDGWVEQVRLTPDRRWYERLHHGPDHDIWVISWLPGQSTGFHDHGASSGAFLVATGTLEEHRPNRQPRVLSPGDRSTFGPDYAHDVRNASLAPAISIHAYSPPLNEMNEYELDGSDLVPRERLPQRPEPSDQTWRLPHERPAVPLRRSDHLEPAVQPRPSTIEQLLASARTRLHRLSPAETRAALSHPETVLVDIRPEARRALEGTIPGALLIERNVLEWRFDPASSARLPIATGHDLPVIVFCSEGYTSSLAAAALQDLGLWRATDMVGGFTAWREAGLPTLPPPGASTSASPGTLP